LVSNKTSSFIVIMFSQPAERQLSTLRRVNRKIATLTEQFTLPGKWTDNPALCLLSSNSTVTKSKGLPKIIPHLYDCSDLVSCDKLKSYSFKFWFCKPHASCEVQINTARDSLTCLKYCIS